MVNDNGLGIKHGKTRAINYLVLNKDISHTTIRRKRGLGYTEPKYNRSYGRFLADPVKAGKNSFHNLQ